MGDLLPFPARPLPAVPPMPAVLDLLITDAELARVEEELVGARAWLRSSRGAGRNRAQVECDELMVELQRLERRRLLIAGPGLALVRGGQP